MNNHEINMYITKFRDEMKFKDKKQGYNFKTKINEYSKRETFNITYELFKLCVQKDKELEELKAEIKVLKSYRDHFRQCYEKEQEKSRGAVYVDGKLIVDYDGEIHGHN